MTNQTIPPCPKCGKVPTLIMYGSKFPFVSGVCQCLSDANLIGNSDRTYPVCWENGVDILLGRACRELGVETVEQLMARLAPDPRVAVLDRLGLLTLDQIEAVLVCAKAAVRASKTEGGIIITEDVTAVIDSIIAAQRGEVEG